MTDARRKLEEEAERLRTDRLAKAQRSDEAKLSLNTSELARTRARTR